MLFRVVPALFLLTLAVFILFIGPQINNLSAHRTALEHYIREPNRDCPVGGSFKHCLSLDRIPKSEVFERKPPPRISAKTLRRVSSFDDLEYLDLSYNRILSLKPLKGSPVRSLKLSAGLVGALDVISELKELRSLELGQFEKISFLPLSEVGSLERISFGLIGSQADLSSLMQVSAEKSVRLVPKHDEAAEQFVALIDQVSQLPNVVSLSISSSPTIEVIEKATVLQFLSLSHPEKLDDLKPLSALSHLNHLEIHASTIKDISAIRNLKGLSVLKLRNTSVIDIGTIAALKKIEILDLSFSDVNDLSDLSELPQLETIYLEGNIAVDLTPLTKMPSLRKLYLGNRKCNTNPDQIRVLRSMDVLIYPNPYSDPADADQVQLCELRRTLVEAIHEQGDDCVPGDTCANSRR